MPEHSNHKVVDYARITTEDKNPLKRRLQSIRLRHSLRAMQEAATDFSGNILDFGAGNGEWAKRAATIFPKGKFHCYEPTPGYFTQVRENVDGLKNIVPVSDLKQIDRLRFSYIFALEVFEHLPQKETDRALVGISRLLDKNGRVIFGVPNEIYLAALFKGIFRMTRRFGEIDASPRNILQATLGRPLRERPVESLADGVNYIFRHIGFDYRAFEKAVQKQFNIINRYGSPFPSLPLSVNSEVFFVCKKAGRA